MNEIIKLAIAKGGLRSVYQDFEPTFVIVDPLFWQALGKALGWKTEMPNSHIVFDGVSRDLENEYEIKAHQYFDLVLTGGDTEKFWKDLLA